MSYRGWLLAAVLLVSGGPLGAEGEFPIGAWFPGMIAGESKTPTSEDRRVWGTRLDSVKAQGFNTIHARQGRGELRTSEYNQAWMALAHARGLKVQLHSWRQPTKWRSHSRNYWTRTFLAEDTEIFTHAIGREVTDDDDRESCGRFGSEEAMYAEEDMDSAGLLLASGSIYLRRNGPPTNSRFGHHVFCLKTDDASDIDHLATLRVLQRDGTVMDSLVVRGINFPADNTYHDFPLEYDIGRRTDTNRRNHPVRYQVEWTGEGNLWVDNIRAHDFEIDDGDTLRPPNAAELFRGAYDDDIDNALGSYYPPAATVAPPWRFGLYDEPRWELNESVVYVDRLIQARTGGTPGISPYNVPDASDAMERYVDTVSPPELLVDFYPFFHDTPAPGEVGYANAVRGRLDWLVNDGYRHARAVSLGLREEDGSTGPRIPLWCVVQVHNHSNLRNPTPEEIRAQVNLALAHGARGIYYYLYHSFIERNEDGTERRRVNGLMDHDFRRTPRLDAVEDLNTMLDALDDTFLELTSDAAFWGDRPAEFVEALSSNDDYFLGAFTHTDGSRYLMVVNTQCGTAGTRTTTVTLDAAALKGDAYDYTLFDVYGDRRLSPGGSDAHPEFEVTLGPGEGTLYRVEADLPVLASFGSSRYEMIEGGDAVTGENPADVGKRVEVTVSLSAAPSERLEVPIEVTFGTKEYTADNPVSGRVHYNLPNGWLNPGAHFT